MNKQISKLQYGTGTSTAKVHYLIKKEFASFVEMRREKISQNFPSQPRMKLNVQCTQEETLKNGSIISAPFQVVVRYRYRTVPKNRFP